MKPLGLLAATVVVALAVGCSRGPSSTPVTVGTTPASTSTTSSSIAATPDPIETTPAPTSTTTLEEPVAPSRIERWITVEYRSTPVDVGHPRFEHLGHTDSSLVQEAWYDSENGYMIIDLNGSKYHYCRMPQSGWSEFTTAASLGSHYNQEIRGAFDCRNGGVPDYD